jgi:CheY-specific phosphatase CheX
VARTGGNGVGVCMSSQSRKKTVNRSNPAASSVLDMMRDHLELATIEMFSDLEIALQRTPASAPVTSVGSDEPSVVAVIGYVGTGVRGALILIALETTVASWLRRMGSEGADAGDALGEFSNMLLGRLKARLLPEGLTIRLATPTIATGTGIRLSVPPTRSAALSFDESAGSLRIRLDANFDVDFAFAETSEADAPPAKAGETILF